jgi:murein DD-endopeptidase MepM/ murein hydrolase activator NlpD
VPKHPTGDRSSPSTLMRRFLRSRVPALVAAMAVLAGGAGVLRVHDAVQAATVEEIRSPASGTQQAERGGRRTELPPAPEGKIPFPVDGGSTCFIYWSSFGQSRGTRLHEGTDIMGVAHQPVYAVVDGTLDHRYTNTGTAGFGWTLIDDETGVIYKYFHLAADPAGRQVGDRVEVGDVIGYVGDSGTIAGNYHLHLEVRPDNVPMQPLEVLDVRNCNVR